MYEIQHALAIATEITVKTRPLTTRLDKHVFITTIGPEVQCKHDEEKSQIVHIKQLICCYLYDVYALCVLFTAEAQTALPTPK